jgi:hypothetical protein
VCGERWHRHRRARAIGDRIPAQSYT